MADCGERLYTRRPLRLPGYDYATPGPYFVTICTRQRRCFLSRIEMKRIYLTRLGEIVEMELHRMGRAHTGINLDSFVIMPNHVHALVILGNHAPRLGGDQPLQIQRHSAGADVVR